MKWRSWRDDIATKSFIVIWVLYNSITASTRVWYAGLPNGALGGFDGPARGTWDMFLRNERWQHGEVIVSTYKELDNCPSEIIRECFDLPLEN